MVRELDLPSERTNPNGSGISPGHPVGACGAILVVKSLYELKRTGGRYAPNTMLPGGGQGIATILDRAPAELGQLGEKLAEVLIVFDEQDVVVACHRLTLA